MILEKHKLDKYLVGGGEMGRLIREKDWSQSSLGTPDQWPQSLRTAVNILLNSQFPMFVWWGPDLITIYNDSYRVIAGDKHPTLLGTSGKDAWAEIWDVVGPLARQVMEEGISTWSEDQLLYINRHGYIEETYFTFSYSPVYDESGNVGGVFCACTETTKSVLASRKIRESEESLRHTIEQAPVAMCLLKGNEYIVEIANQLMIEFWGKQPADVMNKPIFEGLPEARNQGIEDLLNNVFTTGETFIANEHPVELPRNGSIKTVYVNFVYEPYRSGDESITGVMAVAMDVTEQVLARKKIEESEQALKQSNERFELVTKATQDAIWDWEITTGNSYRGEGFELILGYDDLEVNSSLEEWQSLIHPEDKDKVINSINHVLNSDENYWQHEYRVRKKNGEYAYVKDRGIVVRNEAGKAIRMIGAARDTTETRYYLTLEKLEREILEKNAINERDLTQALNYYMEEIESLHPGMYCSVLLKKGTQLFNLASPNLPQFYLNAIEGIEIGNNVGSCGTAAFLKERVVVTDIQQDKRWAAFKQIAEQANLRACWSLPIYDSHGEVIATFACYYKQPKAPSRFEENTIERTGHILQVILENTLKEQELRESNKRYEYVTRATSDAIWDWDVKADRIFFNEAYSNLFGHDHGTSTIDKAWVDYIHNDDKHWVKESFNKAFADPGVSIWQEEYRFVKSDGTVAIVHDRGIIVRDDKGNAVRMIGAMQDITERKKFEATLAQSEAQFRTLANSIYQLAWMADADGWVHWFNDRWFEYTGTDLEEMQGWGWEKVHHPEHRQRVVSFVKEAWQKGEPWELTFPLKSKEGVYKWFLTRAYPVRNSDGKILQWIGTSTDIDAHKQAEALLEDKVKERTTELERKNSELEQFAYAASHDMQEPLRKISVFSNFLLDQNMQQLDERGKTFLTKIDKSVKRMKMIIDDLLQYSHQTKNEQQFIPTDLNEVIEHITTDLDLVIQQKGAVIESGALPEVNAIPGQMHQLFYNLISNAVKFSKPDSIPVIKITANKLSEAEQEKRNLDKSKSFVEIKVSDNGIGFAQEHSKQIFSLFKRLHGKTEYEGTGIGLALCKKIVENHQGIIYAESKQGEGATFKVLLPTS